MASLNSVPDLVFFSLTPEDDDEPQSPQEYDEPCNWIEDSECQENLFHIISLTPEESTIDENNQIHTTFQYFFEELGYFTEEPEPIDPTRDYEQEAKELTTQRDKTARKNHVDISGIPSLDYNSRSGVSSSSSSIHHEHFIDVRSPHYMGMQSHHPLQFGAKGDHHSLNSSTYLYSSHLDAKHQNHHHHYRPSRLIQ
ncbi:hypothetical protein K501DRAFT_285136 [Backusella circina FSU 941]|nr:hypothetical protein K501DRAFT_285136 [Backusella circina FSU 941]